MSQALHTDDPNFGTISTCLKKVYTHLIGDLHLSPGDVQEEILFADIQLGFDFDGCSTLRRILARACNL